MLQIKKIMTVVISTVLSAMALADASMTFTVAKSQFFPIPLDKAPTWGFSAQGFVNAPAEGASLTCAVANIQSVGQCQTVLFKVVGAGASDLDGGVTSACDKYHWSAKAIEQAPIFFQGAEPQTFAIMTQSYTNYLSTTVNPPTDMQITCTVKAI